MIDRDPLRLLSSTDAAKVLGVEDDDVVALLDRGELAEFVMPRPRLRKRYTSRLAIEMYQRRVIADAYRQQAGVLKPIGRKRSAA